MTNELAVTSKNIERKYLESCIPLVAAFFPGKNIKIIDGNALACISNDSSQSILSIEPIGLETTTKNDRHSVNDIPVKDPNELEITRYPFLDIHGYRIFDIHWIDTESNNLTAQISHPDLLYGWKLPLPGQENLFQILLKRAVCLFMGEMTNQTLPWGILTGIRPGKLIYRMQELGYTKEDSTSLLRLVYLVEPDKIDLLEAITRVQAPYVQTMLANPHLISIYISIPFCPSRCYYCSFPSQLSKGKNTDIIQTYLTVLQEEIRETGRVMVELGLSADNIYIGGGTPTILQSTQLNDLLEIVASHIPAVQSPEYTVEAGRPDTIDMEKLTVMKNHQVNRISINPQTMQNDTLMRIGRKHTVADVIKIYDLARSTSNWTINMDLILGLQAEGAIEVINSLDQVFKLKPDNITLHALALKRGSDAWQDCSSNVYTSPLNWQSIQSDMQTKLYEAGYFPYYLYRQKHIAGNLENIGYTKADRESRYNIAVIEEKQDVLGLGAGASSKVLQRGAKTHQNIYHSNDINHYIAKYRDVMTKREQLLRQERPNLQSP